MKNKRTKRHKSEPYPWTEWFRRKGTIVLKRGVQFHCQTHGMANQIRNKATQQGLLVSLKIEGDEIRVTNKGAA